jgi:anthranilate phosphoribosyltransferase
VSAPTPTWPDLTSALLRGEDLAPESTTWAMDSVMTGDVTPVALAGFLVALRAKGETSGEVVGLVESMLAHATRVAIPSGRGPGVDTCGTGGDRSHTVNISTMAAVVTAATGALVVKHGGRAASSAAGSADVLEALGVVIDLPASGVEECLDRVGIGFCFAPNFHPGMRHAGVARRELGVGTVFNVLGPLANPAQPGAQVVGCYDRALAAVMAQALLTRGTRALVVRGEDGLDELSTAAPSRVWDTTDGVLVEQVLDAGDLGLPRVEAQALRGADAAHNAAVAAAVLSGERTGDLEAVRDAVLLNTAGALVAHDAASGESSRTSLGDRMELGLQRARTAIDSGAARDVLTRWVAASRELDRGTDPGAGA